MMPCGVLHAWLFVPVLVACPEPPVSPLDPGSPQWILQLCAQLAEVPQPMMALRLLLAAGTSASEEAGLEMLAYQFFEEVRAPSLSLSLFSLSASFTSPFSPHAHCYSSFLPLFRSAFTRSTAP